MADKSCKLKNFWNITPLNWIGQGSLGNQRQSRWPLSTLIMANGLKHPSCPIVTVTYIEKFKIMHSSKPTRLTNTLFSK